MSTLRCQPWRSLKTFQHAKAAAQAARSQLALRTLNNPITTRALSTSLRRAQNTQPNMNNSPPKPTPQPSTPSQTKINAPTPNRPTTENISKSGLSDKPIELDDTPDEKIDWTRSFHGLSSEAFPKEAADILLAEMNPEEIEVKPDGIVYLPEIKYRRILNKAFGPGGWGLVPRSESIVTPKTVTREYALVCNGR